MPTSQATLPLTPKPPKPWKMRLAQKQQEAVDLVMARGKGRKIIYLGGPKWTGKCVHPNTLVYTSEGPKPMWMIGSAAPRSYSPISQDVLSLAEDGLSLRTAEANQFYNSGIVDAITVATDFDYRVTCSTHHPIWSEHNGEIKFRTSSEIMSITSSGGDVWIPMARKNTAGWTLENLTFDLRYSYKGRELSSKIEVDADVGYLIGLLVGDGCYTQNVLARGGSPKLTSADRSIIDFVVKILNKKFSDGFVSHCQPYDYGLHYPALKAFLYAAGIAEKYAYQKTIPDFIWKSPKAVLVGFLQGLFDTDGTVDTRGGISYCSSSPALAEGVQQALLCLGVRSRKTFKANHAHGGWLVWPREEDGFGVKVGFRLARKQARIGIKERAHKVCWAAYPPSLYGVLRALHISRKDRGVGTIKKRLHRRIINPLLSRHLNLSKRHIEPVLDLLNARHEPELQAYWMNGEIFWDKVKSCTVSREELADLCVPETESFIGNGFINHNTVAGLAALMSHAWHTKGATINVVVPTITTGDDSGVWSVLVDQIIPEWVAADFGMEWWHKPRGPKIAGARTKLASKKIYCAVTNKFGGMSHIELNSLKDERDVEREFFNRYYTMIYWGELQNFRERHTFDTLLQSLRMKDHPDDDFVMLLDGNPSDQGEDSWIWRLFYEFRLNPEVPDEEKPLQRQLQVVEMYLDDNPFLSTEKKQEIKATYKHDPDLYARYIEGKWVRASSDALFNMVFKPSIHVIGDQHSADPEMLLPEDGCTELYCGWDPGSANPAMVIAEKVFRPVTVERGVPGSPIVPDKEESVFKFLDELVFIKENLTIAEFTELVMEKVRFWEKLIGREIQWTHWSDRSAFDQREAISARYQYEEVYAVSGGKILLQAFERSQIAGSKAPGIRLWRKLLFQNRMFFSAAMTPKLIEACRMLKRDTRRGMPRDSVDKNQFHRHVWDSARYLCQSENWDELQEGILSMNTQQRPEPKLLSVKL